MSIARRPLSGAAVEALGKVAVDPEALVALLADLITDGNAYLCGSLGAGLANAYSDVDVEVFHSDEYDGSLSIFFIDNRLVDVRLFSADAPSTTLESFRETCVEVAGGACSLGVSPDSTVARRLGRWATAIPLNKGVPPLLGPGHDAKIGPLLVRHAVDSLCLATYTASLLQAAGCSSGGAWRRAGRCALEVLNRVAGEVYVGDKWTWAKARRRGARRSDVESLAEASDDRSWRRAAIGAGLPDVRWEAPVRVDVVDGVDMKVAGEVVRLVDGRRLIPMSMLERVAEGSKDAQAILTMLAEGAVTVRVDPGEVAVMFGGG